MVKLLLCILFTLTSLIAVAQKDPYADSLKRLLKTSLNDSTRVTVLLNLAEYLPNENEWLFYNRRALKLTEKQLAKSTGRKRLFFYESKGHAYSNLGFYYDYHGQKEQAIDYYFKALFLYDKAGASQEKASVYSNLGVLYTYQGDYKEAEDLLIKALNLKKKYDPFRVAKNYNNLGVLYDKQRLFSKALFYYKKSLMAARRQQNHEDISIALSNIGTYYDNNDDYETAIPLLEEALEECRLNNDEAGGAWIQSTLGNCYMKKGELDKAETFMLHSLEVANRFDNKELKVTVLERLYKLYLQKKEYQKALKYQLKLGRLKEQLNNLTDQKNALRQKLQYDHEMDTARISMEAKQEEERLNQQIWFVSIILLISLVLGGIAYRRFRVSQSQKSIIEEQKRIVEFKNKEITDSINYAKYLQQSMLPSLEGVFSGLSSGFLFYRPKDIVSGDFYWRYETSSFIYLSVADCTGHGVPGAMVSVVCSNALNKVMETSSEPTPGELLDRVRELVVQQFSTSARTLNDGMDISVVRIAKEGNELWFSGANHTCLQIADHECLEYKGNRQSVGKLENPQPYVTHTLKVLPKSWIYLFTDGMVDQFGGEKGKKLKLSVLKDFLVSINELNAAEKKLKLKQFFTDYRGNLEQTDDVCLLGFQQNDLS